jgi:cysteine desulfurase
MKGIAFSSGSSCLSKSFQLPPALSGIGLDPELIRSSILLSLGKDNSADDVGYFLETFRGVVDRLRSMSPGWEDLQSGRTEFKIRAPGNNPA